MPRKNSCNIIGHVGTDAEVRDAGSTQVVSFSVAVSPWNKDRGETQWFRCSWFGDRAVKVANYIRKGDAIDVTGEVTLREYERRDGSSGASLELRVSDVTLLGRRDREEAPPPRRAAPPPQPDTGGDIPDEDIPF